MSAIVNYKYGNEKIINKLNTFCQELKSIQLCQCTLRSNLLSPLFLNTWYLCMINLRIFIYILFASLILASF